MNKSASDSMEPKQAIKLLWEGNKKYLDAKTGSGDISSEIRQYTCEHGQKPYAIVLTCSDSRVIPEEIFSAGIGDIFVIRVAGNVIDNHQLGSIQYAIEHLGTKLVVVLGHTHCGAVGAAISGGADGYIRSITDEIRCAIGDETDDYKACCLNVEHSIERIKSGICNEVPCELVGAVYHIDSGEVEFLCSYAAS